jgi:glycosyltransferase involved in cell wall biosynthesis
MVDEGLSSYFPQKDSVILNIDSASNDDTVKIFKATKTKSSKVAISLAIAEKGKGYNIITGIRYGVENCFTCIITFDADVYSANPRWVKEFAFPILTGEADYVIPRYKRSMYEGNTTNHFSSPLIYTCWGIDIQQPIAGDFSFNLTTAEKIVASIQVESDLQYGIDTVMTWTALGHELKIKEIVLGSKLHNPSFAKIVNMFEQVSFSTFKQIRRYRSTIFAYLLNEIDPISPNTESGIYFDFEKPKEADIINLKIYLDTLPLLNKARLETTSWIDILSDCVVYLITEREAEITKLVSLIKPFFFYHVLSYYSEILTMNSNDINRFLYRQKSKLFYTVKSKILNFKVEIKL